MHRSAIPYPPQIFSKGIGGLAVVEVTPGSNGHVQGILYTESPEELRKETTKAMLLWHFDPRAGVKTRRVRINFDPVEARRSVVAGAAPRPALGSIDTGQPRTLGKVEVEGLSEDARQGLLKSLTVREGDPIDAKTINAIQLSVSNFDHDLRVTSMQTGSEIVVTVTPPGFRLDEAETSPSRTATTIEVDARVPRITSQRIRVAAEAQASELISKVDPIYPPLAKANHTQGVVRFKAVIGDDGGVTQISLLTGPPLLVQAAQNAASQWKYSPTLVNGKAVEVITEIEVEFFLPN